MRYVVYEFGLEEKFDFLYLECQFDVELSMWGKFFYYIF